MSRLNITNVLCSVKNLKSNGYVSDVHGFVLCGYELGLLVDVVKQSVDVSVVPSFCAAVSMN